MNDKRARMLAKVRKLLNFGRDKRGNSNEAETALRQASALMAEYNIEEAEADMALLDENKMIFEEGAIKPDGSDPHAEIGRLYKSVPPWARVLGLGVAQFSETFGSLRNTPQGSVLIFQGEKGDVSFARWLFSVLVTEIQREQKVSGWTSRRDATAFRAAATATLQGRLIKVARERHEAFKSAQAVSGSRALVVVNRKQTEMVARFGKPGTKTLRSVHVGDASTAGTAAGERINIPSARPIGGQASHTTLK